MFKLLTQKPLFIALCLVGLMITSCASRKNVIYLQDIERLDSIPSPIAYQTKIAPNDLLAITVTAENMKAVQPFNLPLSTTRDVNSTGVVAPIVKPYLVNPEGAINFPKLGMIEVKNLTRDQVSENITKKLKKYIKDPRVDVRIQNFKVTVLGEVGTPGTFAVKDERITILEALGLAGDMTIYGERGNVLILREEDGLKKYGRIDMKSSDFLDSPYYYLRQNDVVIVEQNKTEVQRSISNPNTGIYFSIASLLLSVFVIFGR